MRQLANERFWLAEMRQQGHGRPRYDVFAGGNVIGTKRWQAAASLAARTAASKRNMKISASMTVLPFGRTWFVSLDGSS